MSDSMYQNNLGRFGLCSVVWDPDKKDFRKATETEIMWCCLEGSKQSAKTCMEECERMYGPKSENADFEKYTDCRRNCARIILSAENTCALSFPEIWRGNSPLLGCITSFGCGKYPNYDQKCIRENKDSLIKCCNKDCIPTSLLSCTDHCRLKYYDLAGETKDPLLKIFDMYPELLPTEFSTPKTKKDIMWVWLIIGVIVAIFIVIFVIKKFL